MVWEHPGLTSKEIAERLPASKYGWQLKTVNTFLTRLVAKGVLKIRQDEGRAYRYESKIPRDQLLKQESKSFLQRMFGGAAAPLLMYFCEESDLTEAEIRQLREVLDSKKAKPKKKSQ